MKNDGFYSYNFILLGCLNINPLISKNHAIDYVRNLSVKEQIEILSYAQKNGLLYEFSKCIVNHLKDSDIQKIILKIIKKGESLENRFENTLKMLLRILEKIGAKYVIVKTIKPFMDVTFDIDILSDKKTSIKIINEISSKYFHVRQNYFAYELKSLCELFCNVDIYWNLLNGINIEYIIKNCKKCTFNGLLVLIPQPEIDLIFVADNILRKYFIDLSDIANIIAYLNNIENRDKLFNIAFPEERKIILSAEALYMDILLNKRKIRKNNLALPKFIFSFNHKSRFEYPQRKNSAIINLIKEFFHFWIDLRIKHKRPQYGNWF